MAVDLTQVLELVESDAYPAMFERYDSIPVLYPMLGEIVNPAEAGAPFAGDQGSVFAGLERFREREDGNPVVDSSTEKGWTWSCRIKPFSRGITIYKSVLDANDSVSGKGVKDRIISFAQMWGETVALQKDDYAAQMFMQGTLTAGDTTYFRNSYPHNPGVTDGVIYDGLPWFDTAHTKKFGSTTHANHVPSSALSQTTLESGLTLMTHTNAVDERGERILVNPGLLVVPAGLVYTAEKIVGSPQVSGSANNDVNPLNGRLQVVGWRALTNAAAASSWWLHQAGKGLRFYDSGPPTLRVWQERNGDISILGEYYWGAAVTNWRYTHAFNKAAS